MANAQDFTAMMKDMMGAFPVDSTRMEDAFKHTATLNEKLSSVALEAVEKSTDISAKWTNETLSRVSDLAKAKSEPADYAKAMTEFMQAQVETAGEHMAAYAEVAKKVQMDTVELMMATGKDMSEEATANMKKATAETTTAAKKATQAAA